MSVPSAVNSDQRGVWPQPTMALPLPSSSSWMLPCDGLTVRL